jgi:hypothetical protein
VYTQTGSQSNIVEEQTIEYETDDGEFCEMETVSEQTLQTETAVTEYDTDEEEFMRTESRNTFTAVTVTTPTPVQARGPEKTENTAKRNLSAARKKNRDATTAQGYNLAYFNPWWSRMAVEGRKDAKEMIRKEEEARRLSRRMMFTNKKVKTQNKSSFYFKSGTGLSLADAPFLFVSSSY